jgi:Ser/Thr protein kinase RdoA (MazF antagonist)
MRMLADNPSMDYLRREAKELLVALRETAADASLADAQRAVAEMYGMRTWADLKAEVDRRREARPEAPDGLAEGIAEAFGLGRVQGVLTPIRYEYMGRRWCLETDRGRYMVSPLFDWIDDAQAEVAVDLQTRARVAGVASPVPVRTPDGGLVRRVLDQTWRVDEWMDLGPTPVHPVRSSVARRAGELLAAIHDVDLRTDRPVGGPWITIRPSEASWATLLERAQRAGKPWAAELAALSPTIAALSAIMGEARPGEAIISNCDIVLEAVRFGRGDELVVVHWDFAGPMYRDWELAKVLWQWTLESSASVDAARALLDGYRSRSASGAPALRLDSFTAAITGWLNWLHNQACEVIDPETPDREAYSELALRATLDDPLTVAQLQGLLEAVEPVR